MRSLGFHHYPKESISTDSGTVFVSDIEYEYDGGDYEVEVGLEHNLLVYLDGVELLTVDTEDNLEVDISEGLNVHITSG